jgi:hypothetical protein
MEKKREREKKKKPTFLLLVPKTLRLMYLYSVEKSFPVNAGNPGTNVDPLHR